jgi:hypothetical protein
MVATANEFKMEGFRIIRTISLNSIELIRNLIVNCRFADSKRSISYYERFRKKNSIQYLLI